jgi:hypothetical protein
VFIQTVVSLSILCYFAVLWIFPYFMEPQVLASCPDFTMLDYKVDYDNHPLFASGNYTCSRRLDYAVLLKLVYKTPSLPEFTSELYQPSDCHLLAKLVPTFANRGCDMVSVTDPYGCILGLLDRSRYFFFQAAPQLY